MIIDHRHDNRIFTTIRLDIDRVNNITENISNLLDELTYICEDSDMNDDDFESVEELIYEITKQHNKLLEGD